MRKVFTLISLLIVLSMILAACVPAATQAPVQPTSAPAQENPTQPPAQEKPTEPAATEAPTAPAAETGNKVAKLIWTQEFDTLNPHYSNMWFSTVTDQLWNVYPWEFDDQMNPIPVLIKEIPSVANGGVSEDGKTITLKLRDDIKWSDGTPLTSKDFKFTYDMIMSDKNAVTTRYPYDQLASVETPDDHTVVWNFKEPFAPWLGSDWYSILPQHVLQPVFDQDGTIDNAEWNRNPTVSAGPYVFKEWQSGSFARFVRNDNFWGTPAKIDEVYFQFVPDDAAQVAALKANEGDLGAFIAYSDIPDLQKVGVDIKTVASGYNEGWYLQLSQEKGHPALQDVNVRQAIAYAFNRDKLNNDLLLGLTKTAATFWDNSPYADPSIKPYPYDPDKAKQLLDEAGWKDTNGDGTRDKDGVELVLDYGTTTREVRQETQAIAQQELADVGIKLNLLNYESDQFFADFANNGPAYTGELDIMQWSDAPKFPDPDVSYWRCDQIPSDQNPTGTNAQFICDQELDTLFTEQAKQVDLKQRQETFYKISKLMFDKVYWLGLWQDPDIWAVGSRLQNVKLSGKTPFYNIAEWDLTQ